MDLRLSRLGPKNDFVKNGLEFWVCGLGLGIWGLEYRIGSVLLPRAAYSGPLELVWAFAKGLGFRVYQS